MERLYLLRFFCALGLSFIYSMCELQAASLTIKSDFCTLSSLPEMVQALLKASPENKNLDEEFLAASHKRFIDLLDPEKSYFLETEISTYYESNTRIDYVKEWRDGSFQSYKQIVVQFRSAILRSRNIRDGFKNKSFPFISREERLKEFPKNNQELEKKIYSLFEDARAKNEGRQTEDLLQEREKEWLCPLAHLNDLLAQTILKSILGSLDVNSDLMGRRAARFMREKLTKEARGTGILCDIESGRVLIQAIQKGSSAEKTKSFQKGDEILSINEKSCSKMTLEEIDELLREGTQGSLLLQVERVSGGILKKRLFLKSFILEEDRVFGQMRGSILILTVPAFYTNEGDVSTTNDIARIIVENKKKNSIYGILFDIRGNGGGYLTEAVTTCGLFLKTGVVMTALYADGHEVVYRDIDSRIFFEGPIVILTSGQTASAAEVVAQTLKDYGRAVIVGAEKTFGKGSIQMQTVTDMKTATDVPIRYTVGKFYSVAGFSPNGTGVVADIILPGFRKNGSHAISAATLPEKIPERFQDTLNDVVGSRCLEYQRYYIPYIQQRDLTYRKYIPYLREKSGKRMQHIFSLFSLQSHVETIAEKNAVVEQITRTQLEEAENILEDLLEKTKKS